MHACLPLTLMIRKLSKIMILHSQACCFPIPIPTQGLQHLALGGVYTEGGMKDGFDWSVMF